MAVFPAVPPSPRRLIGTPSAKGGLPRCPRETQGQTMCCVQRSLRHWTWPGPEEGDERMRVGKQRREPALPWTSAARGWPGSSREGVGVPVAQPALTLKYREASRLVISFSGGSHRTLLKQASRRLFSLPSSTVSTELPRERGARRTVVLGAVPRGLVQVDTDLWVRGPQEGWAGTSIRRWQAWLAGAAPCTVGPWAPLPAAPAEHKRDGTWQLPAPSATRASPRPSAVLPGCRCRGALPPSPEVPGVPSP